MKIHYKRAFLLVSFFPVVVCAGPPYDTDDPEPVDYKHWEFYCSSIGVVNDATAMGTFPHVEINYGVVPNVQLHVISPFSFYSVKTEQIDYGYGDTEFGIKYRFVNKDSSRFQIGIFPLVEAPTGNTSEHLGNGKTQFYLPLWIQKTIGKLTTYGGGGYWLNPGAGNKNYEFVGWQAQYQIIKSLSPGAEIYYVTTNEAGGTNDFRFRIGAVIDFSDKHHLLLSAGRSIIGNTSFQWYLGYQLTI